MIEARNIVKIYSTGNIKFKALKGISLKIKNGEFTAVMGPSGSGKSTFMNILGCLDRPTSGSYFLDGINVKNLNDEDFAKIRNKQIGFVFQTFNLLPRISVLRNVEMPMIYAGIKPSERKERALYYIRKVGLEEKINNKPTELSGGQKQRVAIARALVNSPSILLADEPTGNLDTRSGEEIMDIFKKLNSEGTSIILVTHEKEIAGNARRIISFRDGELTKDIKIDNSLPSSEVVE